MVEVVANGQPPAMSWRCGLGTDLARRFYSSWRFMTRCETRRSKISPDSGQLYSLDIAKGVSKWAIANV
jgi:hypothetical protein